MGAGERLIVAKDDPWITPDERAGFATTPGCVEIRAWRDRLDAASPLISIETFGRPAQGRDMVAVRTGRGGSRKPVVLVQTGTHAGEIDGKDTGRMLLRDIALGGKDSLLDQVDPVFVPTYNIDGHEASSRWQGKPHRPHHRGPRNRSGVTRRQANRGECR